MKAIVFVEIYNFVVQTFSLAVFRVPPFEIVGIV
jgi:hypothetical protein